MKLKITNKQKVFDFELHPSDKGKGEGQMRIFRGNTYPLLEKIKPQIILDIGGNIGATAVYFALNYPSANIFTFEPSNSNFDILARNTISFPKIKALNKGVFNRDVKKKIFIDNSGGGKNSIHESWTNSRNFEVVEFIDIKKFIIREKIDKIDILKIDTEGCEVKILKAMNSYISDIDVIYLEYHSREDRETISSMLMKSHNLIHESFLKIPISSNYLIGKVLKDDVHRDKKILLRSGTILNDKHRQIFTAMGLKTINTFCDELGEFTFRKK